MNVVEFTLAGVKAGFTVEQIERLWGQFPYMPFTGRIVSIRRMAEWMRPGSKYEKLLAAMVAWRLQNEVN